MMYGSEGQAQGIQVGGDKRVDTVMSATNQIGESIISLRQQRDEINAALLHAEGQLRRVYDDLLGPPGAKNPTLMGRVG